MNSWRIFTVGFRDRWLLETLFYHMFLDYFDIKVSNQTQNISHFGIHITSNILIKKTPSDELISNLVLDNFICQ